MARTSIEKQYERYVALRNKQISKLAKYNLKPINKKQMNIYEFEASVISKRKGKKSYHDVTAAIVKEYANPLTAKQVDALKRNAIEYDASGNAQFNSKINQLLAAIGKTGAYDYILKAKRDVDLMLTQMLQEVYAEAKKLQDYDGATEFLNEIIAEAFWGS